MDDGITPLADPVPAIVTLIPHDHAWEHWVRRRLGPRFLQWQRPRYRRTGPAPARTAAPAPLFARLPVAAERVPIVH